MPRWAFALWLFAGLAACNAAISTTGILAPAPNLYKSGTDDIYPAEDVPKGLRRTLTEILYVTDRGPVMDTDGVLTGYGSGRSDSMAFGVSLVEYGELETWNELVLRTHEGDSRALTRLDPVYLEEFSRFPATPLPMGRAGGRLLTTEEAARSYQASAQVMREELGARLRNHGLNRMLVYIHGFNNEFDDSVGTLANVWHYAGRRSLPISYSWPAGNGGLLGYFRDSESGDYSVFHVKEFLRALASIPEIDKIDIVAHSRGSAVMTDALRELIIEARARGQDPQVALKTGMLVLAAADLDIGVVEQRLVAERFSDGFEQINIYANPDDGALRLSRIIGNFDRLGSLGSNTATSKEFSNLVDTDNVNIIIVKDPGSGLGHSYFRENPAVMSDIVLALRTRERPGTAYRPLEQLGENVWELHSNYPDEVLPDMLNQRRIDR
ncbi:alpha/beta hydrolase [Roseovarius sp. 2305UL8-3]|uniref:alpha/beta hydrolase n=1 Tax=Roseovarius conchicola TaxID=3121636 RepID=UPI003527AE97